MPFALSLFNGAELMLLGLWVVAVLAPMIYAIRSGTSLAMGITVSVLLGAVVQVIWSMMFAWGLVHYWVWSDVVLVPVRAVKDPTFWHTLITAGFLHSQGDMMHVLGNVVILALVGVPLEQRLGTKRFAVIYFIGLLGGSLGWVVFNHDSYTPALGASGAAFGLLGAYLAGWPKDEIPFPLLLIRPWPVVFIALLYFGLELIRLCYHGIGCFERDCTHGPHRRFCCRLCFASFGGKRWTGTVGYLGWRPKPRRCSCRSTPPHQSEHGRFDLSRRPLDGPGS